MSIETYIQKTGHYMPVDHRGVFFCQAITDLSMRA